MKTNVPGIEIVMLQKDGKTFVAVDGVRDSCGGQLPFVALRHLINEGFDTHQIASGGSDAARRVKKHARLLSSHLKDREDYVARHIDKKATVSKPKETA